MSIRREIEVTRKGLTRQIDVTYGTNILPIKFIITDFELPEGATAEVYAMGASGKLVKQSCVISKNIISFTPEVGLFEEGKNVLQLAATYTGKDLFSFYIPVNCQKTMFYEGAQDLKNDPEFVTMIMQMKQELGQLSEDVANLAEDVANLSESEANVTKEQLAQIETNKNNIEILTEQVTDKITTPSSSTVGQILEVETVDVNGKPTSWKTTDKPTSGGETVDLSNYYTKTEIDTMLDGYIDEVAALLGGDA